MEPRKITNPKELESLIKEIEEFNQPTGLDLSLNEHRLIYFKAAYDEVMKLHFESGESSLFNMAKCVLVCYHRALFEIMLEHNESEDPVLLARADQAAELFLKMVEYGVIASNFHQKNRRHVMRIIQSHHYDFGKGVPNTDDGWSIDGSPRYNVIAKSLWASFPSYLLESKDTKKSEK
ncbi:hypothetical protein ACFLZB_00405 [Nanoarchaeota archaeon]